MWQLWREKERAKREIIKMRIEGPMSLVRERELRREAFRNSKRIVMGDPSFRPSDTETYDLGDDYADELEK